MLSKVILVMTMILKNIKTALMRVFFAHNLMLLKDYGDYEEYEILK